jgi:type I restriction enzyme S subunit
MTAGYEGTIVGAPAWPRVRLDSVAKRGSGHTPDKQHAEYWSGSIKWISLKDSDRLDQVYIADTAERITPAGIANSSAVEHPAGTVVLSRDAGVGKSAITQDVMAVSQHFMAWQCGPNLDNHFLYYWLQHKKAEFERIAIGNTIKTIGLPYFRAFEVPLPSLPEQRAIATALSDVDALLTALDRLIAKKRDLKQGVMQELLTGRRRLPGFKGEWTLVSVGVLGTWFSGGTPSMANESYWLGDIPWVSPKDMKVARIHDAIDHVGPSAIGNGTRLLPIGAILVVVRGMILAHSAPVARAERPVAFNQDIKGLVVRADIDGNFVLWWLVANEQLLLAATTESTHGTKRLATDELFKLPVRLPTPAEQSAIAAVLSDMDAELTALEARRDKTRLLKQGMMQELLTGRTRLV